ncbi:hypothetical protein [Pseudonocardia thermophila]|uniref:hypothetical protein n=1 Tax=Pseudonocardia thermophila TaxID=1848 RepID=UPI00093646FD|nr:hypothetical protein [Pseudonocardia thermophila]
MSGSNTDDVQVCVRCGRRRDPQDHTALAWSSAHEGGTTSWLCPECARHHVRDIEARVDREWWRE